MMLRRALLAGVAVLAALHPAKADFTFTLGTGATGFSFTSTTGGTALCAAASTHCFASVPINTAGAQLFTSGVPGVVNATQWASVALGAPSNFGTTPGAVIVPGVNAALPSVTGTKAPGTAAANSILGGCVYNSGGVTLTDGQQVAEQCDANGNRKVVGTGIADGATNAGTTGSKVDCLTTTSITGGTTATVNPLNCTPAGALRSDLSTLAGTAIDTNSGNKSAGTLRNVLATDQLALAAWGQGANGAIAPTSSTQEGCRSASTAPTEVTDGQMTPIQCGLGGKQIVMPFTVKELAARGKGTATASTGATTIIAAGSGSNKTYVTDWECSNTSATNVTVTFNDGASTQIIVPATGGNNKGLQIPLVTAAATAFTFASDTSVTSVICNAQGYYAL